MDLKKLKDSVDKTLENTQEKRDKMKRFLKQFKGQWWNDEALDKSDSRAFANLIFATIQSIAPLLTDNRPKWDVFARKYYMQSLARLYSDALEYLWDKLRMDKQVYLAVKDALLYGLGIFKIYFDPDRDDGLGEVRVDAIDPVTFVIAEGYEELWDASWCGQVRPFPVSWVRRMYPDKIDEVETMSGSGEEKSFIDPDSDLFSQDSERVIIYEIWMRDDTVEKVVNEIEVEDEEGNVRTEKRSEEVAKYPNGRIVTFTDNMVVLDDRPSPFEHGKPPYVALYDYRVNHSFWGMGEPDQIEGLNKEFNIRLQRIVQNANNNNQSNWVIDGDAGINASTAKRAIKEGGKVLTSNGQVPAKDAIVQISGERLNPVHFQLAEMISNLIEEVTGVTDISKGQAEKKARQSASEVSVLIESSYTRTRQKVRNLEWAIQDLTYLMLELMQQYYVEPRSFYVRKDDQVSYGMISNSPNMAAQAAEPPAEIQNLDEEEMTGEERAMVEDYRRLVEEISGEETVHLDLDIQIQTNSTLPFDKQSLANLVLKLAQMKVVDAEAVLEILNFPGANKIIERLNEEKEKQQKAAAAQAQAKGAGGGGQKPPGGDLKNIPPVGPQDLEDARRAQMGGGL